MMKKRDYDTSVARIAGNVLSGLVPTGKILTPGEELGFAKAAVRMARLIVTAVCDSDPQKETEPADKPPK